MIQPLEMPTTKHISNEPSFKDRERARIFMMWLSMFVIFVMFAAFGSYIIIKQAEGNWAKFDVPIQFTQSTVVLLISSITMTLGSLYTKKANKLLSTIFIFSTLILGIIFTYLQWDGWKALIKNDIFVVDSRSGNSISGSLFYVITALHLAHVFGGLISLLVTGIRAG